MSPQSHSFETSVAQPQAANADGEARVTASAGAQPLAIQANVITLIERALEQSYRLARGLGESILFGFPLFQREMLEQSHRGRTFILRATFACVLFLVALFYSSANSGTSVLATAFGMTGQGRAILEAMVWMLFLAIYLFGPALACGALTAEKERDTLTLLYLTKLGPWQVVLEKYLSRLVPMLAILLLALPLLSFAYAFGGLTRGMISTAMWFLLLTVVQVTAVSVMCSAIFRNTAKSFLWTYLILFLMTFGLDTADHWLLNDRILNTFEQWEADAWKPSRTALFNKTYVFEGTLTSGQLAGINTKLPRPVLLNPLCGPVLFEGYGAGSPLWTEGTRVTITILYRELPFTLSPHTLAGVPILLSALICLVIARIFVYRDVLAISHSESPGKRLWKRIRIWYSGSSTSNESAGLTSISQSPPSGRPIAWRESGKGFWGRALTLLLLLLIEFPTVLILLILTGTPSSLDISKLILSIWGVSTLLITVHASMLITKERSRQTLELLLTTPLSSAEIARQKFAGTQRLIILCAVPLLTCIAFQAWWRGLLPAPIRIPAEPPFQGLEYFVTQASCVAIYLPLVAWISLWMGLKYQHPTRATMAAIAAIGLCSVASSVLLLVTLSFVVPLRIASGVDFAPLAVATTSPISMLYISEFVNLRTVSSIPYLPAILNCCIFGYIFYDIRRRVLERSEFFLGRKVTY